MRFSLIFLFQLIKKSFQKKENPEIIPRYSCNSERNYSDGIAIQQEEMFKEKLKKGIKELLVVEKRLEKELTKLKEKFQDLDNPPIIMTARRKNKRG